MAKAQVKVTDTIKAPIADVWKLVEDFGGLDKIMDAVETCETEGEGIGMLRKIPMGGSAVVERLEECDAGKHRLAYSIIEGPLPFKDYYAVIELASEGGDTRIDWTGTFEPAGVTEDQAKQMVNGIYSGGIKGFKSALGAG